ncbi:MAG: helix-turn-helix domain-containing protein [Bdellovibrionaceae bacterium]|nr:helix-turn-helix domain-containing protein [Pseudobdellovibrionaceae bacterium]NUM60309.1 helix-turn-helix domain-containing protein [Pseudobdellovibrionaceae bacterium]
MKNYKTLINHIDIEIKNANFEKSAVSFTNLYRELICKNKEFRLLNREIYLEAAILARRLSLFKEGLALLKFYVYPRTKLKIIATAAEKVEYASLLSRLGLYNEAHRLLSGMTSKDYSKVHLLKGFSYITQWDHEKAIQELTIVTRQLNIEEYDKLIAKVNILFSLCFQKKWIQAKTLGDQLLKISSNKKSNILQSNILEAMSDIACNEKNFAEAKHFIQMSEDLINDKKGLDFLLIQKQKLVIDISENGLSQNNIDRLESLKKKFIQLSRFEVVRDLDLILARYKGDLQLALKIFATTPYKDFKSKIIDYFPKIKSIDTFDLLIHKKPTHIKKDLILDIQNWQLRMSPVIFKLLLSLFKHGYSLPKLEDIFNFLYPSQNYDYEMASDRVYQQIKRLRQFLRTARIPLIIKVKHNRYFLTSKAHSTVYLRIKLHHDYLEEKELKFKKYLIKESLREEQVMNLSTKQICEITKIHPRKVRRIKALKK